MLGIGLKPVSATSASTSSPTLSLTPLRLTSASASSSAAPPPFLPFLPPFAALPPLSSSSAFGLPFFSFVMVRGTGKG